MTRAPSVQKETRARKSRLVTSSGLRGGAALLLSVLLHLGLGPRQGDTDFSAAQPAVSISTALRGESFELGVELIKDSPAAELPGTAPVPPALPVPESPSEPEGLPEPETFAAPLPRPSSQSPSAAPQRQSPRSSPPVVPGTIAHFAPGPRAQVPSSAPTAAPVPNRFSARGSSRPVGSTPAGSALAAGSAVAVGSAVGAGAQGLGGVYGSEGEAQAALALRAAFIRVLPLSGKLFSCWLDLKPPAPQSLEILLELDREGHLLPPKFAQGTRESCLRTTLEKAQDFLKAGRFSWQGSHRGQLRLKLDSRIMIISRNPVPNSEGSATGPSKVIGLGQRIAPGHADGLLGAYFLYEDGRRIDFDVSEALKLEAWR